MGKALQALYKGRPGDQVGFYRGFCKVSPLRVSMRVQGVYDLRASGVEGGSS